METSSEIVDAIRRLPREDAIKLLETVVEIAVITAERNLLTSQLEAA